MGPQTNSLSLAVLAIASSLGIAILLALLGLAWRSRYWRKGRRVSVSFASGLLKLPRRYLVDLHQVVDRDPASSRMHVMVAGGLVGTVVLLAIGATAALVASATTALLGGAVPNWLAMGLLASSFCVVAGGVAAQLRRRRPRTLRRSLSSGWWRVLGPALGCLGLAIFIVLCAHLIGARADVLWWIDGLAAMVALPGLAAVASVGWGGPLKHAAAGALYLAAHPRPARFGGSISTALQRPPEGAGFGTARAADMPWTRLLSADACVECGRCEAVCPAFAAGMPLNPKALIRNVLESSGIPLRPYAGAGHPGVDGTVRAAAPGTDAADEDILPAFLRPETLWSCTTCRACVDACPMFIEHVDTIIDLRRHVTMQLGEVPAKGAMALLELREADEPGGRDLAHRFDWAFDLGLPVLPPGGSTDVLLWVGDGAFQPRSQTTLRALVKLLQRAGVQVAVLGAEERDCGDLARRLGDEVTFARLARSNIQSLSSRRFRRILTADPHVLHCLRNEYPAFGGDYQVVHHTAFLLELMAAGKLSPGPIARKVTYHDPCYLARYNGETEPARSLLRGIGIKVVEMQRSGLEARCCGAGGGVALTDMRGEKRISDMRMDDACEVDAEIVAVACPNCMNMLGATARLPVLDIAELVEEAMEGVPS